MRSTKSIRTRYACIWAWKYESAKDRDRTSHELTVYHFPWLPLSRSEKARDKYMFISIHAKICFGRQSHARAANHRRVDAVSVWCSPKKYLSCARVRSHVAWTIWKVTWDHNNIMFIQWSSGPLWLEWSHSSMLIEELIQIITYHYRPFTARRIIPAG